LILFEKLDFLIEILTGIRSGELHALTWDQVDLEKGIIIVDRSYNSNMKISGPTKGRYWRIVPISSNRKKPNSGIAC